MIWHNASIHLCHIYVAFMRVTENVIKVKSSGNKFILKKNKTFENAIN